MKEVSIDEIQASLPEYLQLAEEEEILITRSGEPIGLLVGFESKADWEDHRIENDPRFLKRVAAARQRLRAGQGVRMEEIDWE